MIKQLTAAAAVLAGLLLSGTTLADANIYRWKDQQGNLVVSDRVPPAGVEYETISTKSSVVHRVDDEAPPEAVSTPKQPTPPKAPDPKEPAKTIYKKNPQYCKDARSNLEILERPRIRVIGEDGEAYFLSEEERAEERRKAMETVEAHCE